jgi:hypothetical protein
MEKISVKQGATLSLAGLFTLPAGTWTASSNIEATDGTIIAALDVTLTELAEPDEDGNTHSVLMVCTAAQAETFEVGKTYVCDLIFTDDSPEPVVLKTDTFGIKVVREVT